MIRKGQSGLSRRRPGDRGRAGRRRARAWTPEGLEDRVLLSGLTYTVDQTTDTGAGSGTTGDLRYCITQADANPGSTIQFSVTGTIALGSALPDATANMTINGPGASSLTVQGTSATRVLAIDGATVNISSLTIANGTVTGGGLGGGLFNNNGTLTVTSCTFTGDAANTGGAIDSTGQLTVNSSTFSGNSAYAFGGALWNAGTMTVNNSTFSHNFANDSGGAIENDFRLTVSGCTFNGNSVGGGPDRGGAIQNYFATANISNSTFVNNSAALGGALDNYYSSSAPGASHAFATLTDVTMTGGGIDNEGDTQGDLTLVNSVIAGNSGGDVIGWVNGFNSTYNLIGDGSQMYGISNGSNGNQVGTSTNPINAKLGTLSNNGGPTQTVPLLAGSPALDAAGGAATTDTDQRGVPRGTYLDIGAYQATASRLNVSGFPSPTATGASHSFTVAAVDSFGQPSLDFNAPVTFTSTDPSATLPTGQSLAAGQGTFNATLNTPGVQSITATADGLSGSQTGIAVGGASASFLGKDATTQGSWINKYGAQGYEVINNATSLPSYASVTTAGQSGHTWASGTTDVRALQEAGGSGRIAACWYANGSFKVQVDITDGQQHDLELYFLDWDTTSRGEQVQITDASSGAILSTQAVTSFHNGVYLNYTVGGNILITITRQSGANAVLSGLFFDSTSTPTPTPTATFLKQDATTQGTWINTYGSQGYEVINNATSLPSYATVTASGQSSHTWATGSSDPRALQVPGGSGGIAACWFSPGTFAVDVDLTDDQQHDLELYFLDWDTTSRAETVQISDAATGAVLSTQSISSFHNGVYLDYAVSGNILITIKRTGGANAVLSGLFLDPAANATTSLSERVSDRAGAGLAVPSSTVGATTAAAGVLGVTSEVGPASSPSRAVIQPPARAGGRAPVVINGPGPDGTLLRATAPRAGRRPIGMVQRRRLDGRG